MTGVILAAGRGFGELPYYFIRQVQEVICVGITLVSLLQHHQLMC